MADSLDYLAHFTKDTPLLDAYDALVNILTQHVIKAYTLPWTNNPAVCFTECPWPSLVAHAKHYAPYGIGFSKPHVFAAGGGPAYYVRADLWEKQEWADHVKTFVTPFWPAYRPDDLKSAKHLKGKTVDYSHEREWRVPHDFNFDCSQVEFIVMKNYEDMAKFPKKLKDEIGRNKFILLEIYENIERLWPTHIT